MPAIKAMPSNLPANRLDADEGPLFARDLDYVSEKMYEEKLAPVTFRTHLPVTSNMPAGATTYSRRYWKGYGHAKFLSDMSLGDFSSVDISASEVTVKAKDIGVSYRYNIDEIRRSLYAGVPLEARRAVMARVVIERKLDTLAWNGDSDHGIQGFIKYPGTLEYTVPATGTGSSKLWSTKTAAQILTDLNGIRSAVYVGTSGVESIDTILLPFAQLDLIRNMPIGTASDTTVLEFFLRNNPGVTVAECRNLDGAGTASADMMIAYKKDPNYVNFEVPIELEQFEPEKDGMNYVIPMRSRVVGTIVFYPYSVCWAEGI